MSPIVFVIDWKCNIIFIEPLNTKYIFYRIFFFFLVIIVTQGSEDGCIEIE